MSLEIISAVFSLAEKCYEISQEVKSFKKSSKMLAERIKLLIEPIKLSDETLQSTKDRNDSDYNSFLVALEELRKCVEEVEVFLKELKERTFFGKIHGKSGIADNFTYFNAKLDGLVPGLVLILQLQQRDEYIDKLLKLQGIQETLKDDMENIENYVMQILAEVTKFKELLPGKSLVPLELREIKLNEFKGMKSYGVKSMFGELYFATYKPFDGMVAVKSLPKRDDVRTNLMKEATLLKKFESPHIVKLWGICIEDGNNMIVFEYMKYGTLRKFLDESPQLTVVERLRMARDGALGLYHIHHNGMLHRALTSSKFLVDQHFKVKISDVGLSKTWDSAREHSLQPTNEQKKYYAPELLNDMKKKYNIKCEIYCFGIILWEIMTGKQPYQGMSEIDIQHSASKGEKLPIPDDIGAPGELISECMEDNPLVRPDISDIVDRLRVILKQHNQETCE